MRGAGGRPRRRAAGRATALLALLALLGACTSAPEVAPDPTPSAAPSVAADPPGDRAPDPGPSPPETTAEPAAELPPEPASRPELVAHLERVVGEAVRAAPELTLAVLVVDEHGRELAAHQPDLPVLPASTLKQITAAAALTTLGPGAQLPTVVDATAGIDGAGRLDGDLVLIGSGDPTLVTEEYARFIYPARPRTSLADLADQLVDAGLRHVTGEVRGSAPAFAPPALPTGWREDYLSALDGRYPAGLTVDGGLRTLIELPEVEDGTDEDDPDAAEDEDETDGDEDDPDAPPVSILEQLAALDSDLPPTVRTSLVEDPVLHTAEELRRLLRERGVVVEGGASVEPAPGPTVARLASVSSPPLAEVLRFAVQRSDNHLSDALALAVARARTGEGSWAAAERALGQVLDRFGVPRDGAAFADGSGLSRDDRVTARMLVELDRRLTADVRFGGTWRSLQAVAGRSGTLERRLRGTPADGRLLGKTGTLRDVAALSAQVITADVDPDAPAAEGERRYHLAVLGNDADAQGRGVTRAVVDEIALALIADLDGCDLGHAEAEDGPLGRPPTQVRCPG